MKPMLQRKSIASRKLHLSKAVEKAKRSESRSLPEKEGRSTHGGQQSIACIACVKGKVPRSRRLDCLDDRNRPATRQERERRFFFQALGVFHADTVLLNLDRDFLLFTSQERNQPSYLLHKSNLALLGVMLIL